MATSNTKKLFAKGFQAVLVAALIGLSPVVVKAAETQQAAPAATAGQAAPVQEAAPAEPPAPVGDAGVGKTLFTGERSFQNGGPGCISCHSAGVGELGGGTLAPNLTKAFADPTKNALLSTGWVNGGGSPTMGPIFTAKNITDQEMAHLRAFLEQASQKEAGSQPTGTFVIIGLIGFVAGLILISIIWSNRYSKRTQNTAHEALWRNYGGKGGR